MALFFHPGAQHLAPVGFYGGQAGNVDPLAAGKPFRRLGGTAFRIEGGPDVGTVMRFHHVLLAGIDLGKTHHQPPGRAERARMVSANPVFAEKGNQFPLHVVQGGGDVTGGNFLGSDFQKEFRHGQADPSREETGCSSRILPLRSRGPGREHPKGSLVKGDFLSNLYRKVKRP